MLTDPIADLLTRIRNAVTLSKAKVELPNSKMKGAICLVLKKEGFIGGYNVIRQGKKKILEIYLKYSEEGEPIITYLERVSKPGRREYIKKKDVPGMIRGGLGICILSTSKGVIANLEARKLGVGGEILCYVW